MVDLYYYSNENVKYLSSFKTVEVDAITGYGYTPSQNTYVPT
jgi:hypothetical protein